VNGETSTAGRRERQGCHSGRRMPRAKIEEFYRRFFPVLVRHAAWKFSISEEDAEDMAQETFVLALLKMGAKGNARAWFFRVVDQMSVNLQRKEKRRAAILERWGEVESERFKH